MSQINYIQQINMFMEYGKRKRLTSYERMFWIGLFHIANDMAQKNPNREWPDDFFPVPNSDMSEWTGLEERNIRSIRNRFRQMGLIDFIKGEGTRHDPQYRIMYLRYDGYRIEPATDGYTAGDKNAPDSAGGSVRGSVRGSAGGTVRGTAGGPGGILLYNGAENRMPPNINTNTNANTNANTKTTARARDPFPFVDLEAGE